MRREDILVRTVVFVCITMAALASSDSVHHPCDVGYMVAALPFLAAAEALH